MLTQDANFVIYHIGNKSYIFEPGYSPRQIDYDDYFQLKGSSTKEKYFLNCIYAGTKVEDYYLSRASQKGKDFMQSICNKKGLFASIEEHFKDYEVSEKNTIPTTKNVKH